MKRARVSAVFNLFAFVMMVILLMVLPRFSESLHPGKGGNPAFNKYDLDSSLRTVFYPAVIGWILLGHWIYTLRYRYTQLQHQWEEEA
jgi:heme exporter protein C